MEKYDVIIIGAGIAGATFGYLMRIKNKKVLIIEKEKIANKEKLCGGLLSQKSYNLFKTIFNIDNDNIPFKNSRKCVIHNGNTTLNLDINTFSIYRKDIDSYVLEEYLKKGGQLIDNSQYEELDLEKNTLKVNSIEYKFDYLIGADGALSRLRKAITGKNANKNFALEIAYDKTPKELLEIYFFDNFKGYGWIIPNQENAMIGIGNVNQETKIKESFNLLLKQIDIDASKNIKGAFLPTGDDIYLNYKNVFFIGDSAGLISPITGEGIYYALISAKILSENLDKNYLSKMNKVIRELKSELFLKKYVYNDKLRNYLFSRYNNSFFIKKAINHFIKKII